MKMTKHIKSKTIAVQISPRERETLMLYTDTPMELINRIDDAIDKAQSKRAVIKRVTALYTSKELNVIISKVAAKADQRNLSEDTQYILNCLFGRLATKYNRFLAELADIEQMQEVY